MTIINDGLDTLLDTINGMYPDLKDVKIIIADFEGEEGCISSTVFPGDGDIPAIFVNKEISIHAILEVIIHETAHIVRSKESKSCLKKHDQKWKQIFADIEHSFYTKMLTCENKLDIM